MIRVADYIMKFLCNKGVNHLFLLPGGGAMFLNDGVAACKEMQYTAVHHEQSATMAAEAYARCYHTLGVAMVTAGPGASNAITGVLGAWIDSTPLLILSGQCKTIQTIESRQLEALRQLGAQEAPIIPMVKGITKLAVQVREPMKIKYYLEKAYTLAMSGRPGPVWLDIPLDVQGALIDETLLEGYRGEEEDGAIDNKKISEIAALLKKAKRPLIIAGNGMRGIAKQELLQRFIKTFQVPVVTTRLGCDVLTEQDPYFIGRVGIRGNRAGNFAMQNADLILALGTRLSIPVTGYDYNWFAREAKIVMVDLDENELNKQTIAIDYPIKGEVGHFLEGLQELLVGEALVHEEWLDKCQHWKKHYPVCIEAFKTQDKWVNSYYLLDILSEAMETGEVMISDAGSAIDVVYHGFKVKEDQKVILSGGLASMGYALPAAIGASIHAKDNVVVVTGDGSAHMNIQELATLAHTKKKIKIFVLNNKGYLTIRGAQNNHFNGRLLGEGPNSGLTFPNFEQLARAYQIGYVKLESHDELQHKIKEILASDQMLLCEVMMDEHQLIAPKQASKALEDGRMQSSPLEDMAPFLDREVFAKEMIVKMIQ